MGSHLSEALLSAGWETRGVDCFSDYYDRSAKERNLAGLRGSERFELLEDDLLHADLDRLLEGVDVLFHQAGQPGVRGSWGARFDVYLANNVLSTQRLLETALRRGGLSRFVFASSSSVYGDSPDLPYRETTRPQPVSPYGVSKLAAEHLCRLYSKLGVPAVSLRYFTVYGPRQRPDMAFTRFIEALLQGREIPVYGDGEQTRDFTFVSDIVAANLAAASAAASEVVGRTFNLGGGSTVSVNQVLDLLQKLTGARADVRYHSEQPGDARHTAADCGAARRAFGYVPRVGLEAGLRAQIGSLQAST